MLDSLAIALEPYATLVNLLISSLTLVALVVSAFLLYRQIKKEHEWNRLKTSQDLLMSMVTGDFSRLRQSLEVGFGVRLEEPDQDYPMVAKNVPEAKKREFDFNVEKLLNFYETIAIGMKNHILDETVCYEHFSWNLTRYWRWAEVYHTNLRGLHPTIWMEAAHFAKKWKTRLDQEIEAMRSGGKPPL